ncbi:MAG TPA: winged helix-turn-helix domain-containing protein [Myxococcaceae bacterium]|nr:winged helix-turn-helix domain-containing protein [Myxococcaceae bacterium]
MALPDLESAMQLILNLSGDGLEHALLEAVETVARNFQTTVAERAQLLPSGRDRVIYSRVAWAKTHLQKAGLLEAKGRGRFQISERGRAVIESHPPRIDLQFLKQFPEYLAFQYPA